MNGSINVGWNGYTFEVIEKLVDLRYMFAIPEGNDI